MQGFLPTAGLILGTKGNREGTRRDGGACYREQLRASWALPFALDATPDRLDVHIRLWVLPLKLEAARLTGARAERQRDHAARIAAADQAVRDDQADHGLGELVRQVERLTAPWFSTSM